MRQQRQETGKEQRLGLCNMRSLFKQEKRKEEKEEEVIYGVIALIVFWAIVAWWSFHEQRRK